MINVKTYKAREYPGPRVRLPSVVPSEHAEQKAVFQWAALMVKQYPDLEFLHAIPNGGLRNAVVAAKLKAEGCKRGISDMHLPVARGKYIGLWIELKAGKNKPTAEQRWWIESMNKKGHYACVCYGASEAIKTIEKYLTLKGIEREIS